MSSINDNEKQELLAGLDSDLLQRSIGQVADEEKGNGNGHEASKPHYPVLVPGKYIGNVTLSVEKVKSGVNAGRPKVVFALTVSKGDLKGGKIWHHRVINPTFLERATQEEKEQHNTGLLKLLHYCGVRAELGESWADLIWRVENIGNNTNQVRFTVKENPKKTNELSPYIDGAHFEDDGDNGLFNAPIGAGETLPDGKDFPA